jgi:DNA-binding NtrC family response regulator
MSATPHEPSARDPSGTSPAVLVIDDDACVRAAMRRFLEREGYQVVECTSGREALGRLRDGVEVRLVATDLRMKDGSGGWLLAQLGYEFPALLPRTLVMSGDADGAAAAHVAARWHCPILPKPFGAAELIDALQAIERAG